MHSNWVITTRLDNDDALSKQFVETLKQHFYPIDNLYINFEKHVQYIEQGNKFYYYNFIKQIHNLVTIRK